MLSSTEQSVRLDLVHPVTLQIYRSERAKRLRTATKLSSRARVHLPHQAYPLLCP